jgi:hypothetical protein
MRARDKAKIWRRFVAGESGQSLVTGGWVASWPQLEDILREGLAGKFDPVPMNQARAYARAAGVKVGGVVGV